MKIQLTHGLFGPMPDNRKALSGKFIHPDVILECKMSQKVDTSIFYVDGSSLLWVRELGKNTFFTSITIS